MNRTTAKMNNMFLQLTYVQLLCAMIAVLSGCELFDGNGGGGSTSTTPGVTTVDPANGDSNVEIDTLITATFTGGIDSASVNNTSFILVDSVGNAVSGLVDFDTTNNIATFTPSANLAIFRTYSATLSADITHSGGTPITAKNWSFTTRDGVWSSAATIETDFYATTQTGPHIALGGNGDAMAIWSDGANYILGNKYTASSGTWGSTEQLVFNGSTNTVSEQQVAMDINGNAMAVWSLDQPGGKTYIYARYYDGTNWGTATNIGINNSIEEQAQVAFDGSGNAIVVWLQEGDIYYNRYSSGAWEGAQLIESGAGTAYKPQLAVFANGDAIAVWAQYDSVATYNVIYTAYYTTGSGWSGEVSLGNSEEGSIPQVALDSNGNAIAVWIQGTNPYGAWAAHYDSTAPGWGTPVELDNDVHINTVPRIGVSAQGNGIAIWRAAPTTGPDRLRYKLYSGSDWGTVGNMDDGSSDAADPQLSVDAAGNAIVVWRQASNSIDSMWTNRYQSGNGWGTPELLELDDTSPVTSPEVAVDSNGNAFAIWIQSDGSFASTWVSRFE